MKILLLSAIFLLNETLLLQKCQTLGGYLLSVHNQAESSFITNQVKVKLQIGFRYRQVLTLLTNDFSN